MAFVLPGFLLIEARSISALASLSPITKESVAAFVVVTVIYNLILWSFGLPVQTADSISNLKPSLLLKTYAIAPAVIGFLFGLSERYWVMQRLLRPFGINAASPVTTAWVEIFSQQQLGTYLIVLLKDGSRYNAMVTRDTRFGSDPENPDLFLGQTYSLTDWNPSNPQRGVYIRGSEIQSVEIIRRP